MVGRDVAMVLRLGPWRLLMLVSWMTYFLSLFGYPSWSGESLVDGSLGMRYCSTNFPVRKAYMEVAAFWWCGCLGCCGWGSPVGSWFAGFRGCFNYRRL